MVLGMRFLDAGKLGLDGSHLAAQLIHEKKRRDDQAAALFLYWRWNRISCRY
jgi:hypothetical protein